MVVPAADKKWSESVHFHKDRPDDLVALSLAELSRSAASTRSVVIWQTCAYAKSAASGWYWRETDGELLIAAGNSRNPILNQSHPAESVDDTVVQVMKSHAKPGTGPCSLGI